MNLRVVEYLVKAGADNQRCDREGNNALQIVIKSGKTRIVSYLLNHKFVDPCVKNYNGQTAITISAIYADGDMMKTLLEEGKGSDKCVDDIDKEANNPLMRSLRVPKCQLGVVEILVAAGARLGIRDLRRNSILHHAAKNCGKDVVSFLLQKVIEKEKQPDWAFVNDSTDDEGDEGVRCKMVNCRNNIGDTPLMSAVSTYFGKREPPETLEVVKALVECGARVNATNTGGESALRYAIENEYIDCALYLLEQKADATVIDKYGNTLFYTVHRQHVWTRDLVQALTKAGTPLNVLNNNGETAITHTLKRDLEFTNAASFYTEGSKTLYEHILVAGEDVNKPNLLGEFPLQIVVDHSHLGLTKLFLRYNAFTEVRNAAQDTPLLALIKRYRLDGDDMRVIEALLNARADVCAKDADNRCALDILLETPSHL